jgi:hypothetical protein
LPRTNTIQTNFTAGELTPRLEARVDIAKYANGCSVLENMIVLPHGGAARRGGTKFVVQTKTAADKARLVPFEFNVEQTYAIEFGDQYIRFYRNNGIILEASDTITAITAANPGVLTITGHSYSDGDWVYISGIVGMTELNNKYYIVANQATNTIELTDLDGNAIDTSAFTAYSSGGITERVYEVATPWLVADIFDLQFTQSADILYVTHPDYSPREISRTGNTSWIVTEYDFQDGPYLAENNTTTTLTLSATTGSVNVTASAVTGINDDAGFLASDVGRLIRWKDAAGDWTWLEITAITSTTIVVATIRGADASATTATVSWRLGYFKIGNYPSAVCFYEQRLCFGGSNTYPQLLVFSESGNYTGHAPGTSASDPMVYTIATDQVNAIKWFSPGSVLVVGTVGGEFVVSASDQNEALTPTNIRVVRQTNYGCAATIGLRVSNVVLFVQRAQRKLREFVYRFESDTFVAPDLTLLAEHITSTGITDTAYQQEPDSIVWCVLTDGSLVGMTYQRDQEVIAWHRHSLGGTSDASGTKSKVESITVIPGTAADGAGKDVLWMTVKRYVNGNVYRYVEILQNGLDTTDGQEDVFFVDSGVTFDSPLTISAITAASPGVLTVTGHTFSDGDYVDIRDIIGMTELNTNRYLVANAATNTLELTTLAGVAVDTSAYTAYISGGTIRLAASTISGLDHLEGQTLAIVGNGAIQSRQTVSGGAITLATRASIVHLGLPYTSRLVTMNVEAGQADGTAQGRTKRIHDVIFRLYRSLGVLAGPVGGPYDIIPFRDSSDLMGAPPALYSGDKTVPWPKGYETDGKIEIRQEQALPQTVLAIIANLKTND